MRTTNPPNHRTPSGVTVQAPRRRSHAGRVQAARRSHTVQAARRSHAGWCPMIRRPTATTRERQRQELDRQQPLDASGNLAERVRATTFTADAKGAADADADAEAPGRGARAGVDGEKTPILAALAQLRNKQSERARRGSAPPRLRPVPSVGKPPPGRGLVGGGREKERPKPAAPKSAGRGGPAPRF